MKKTDEKGDSTGSVSRNDAVNDNYFRCCDN